MQREYLFVYGSLAPSKANSHLLTPLNGHWQKAWVRGHLFRKGRQGTLGYPALTPDEQAPWQEGLLFSHSKISPTFWQALDQFEGSGYQGMQVTGKLANRQFVRANIYAYRDATIRHNCP